MASGIHVILERNTQTIIAILERSIHGEEIMHIIEERCRQSVRSYDFFLNEVDVFECVVHPQEVLGGGLNLPDGIYVWKSFVSLAVHGYGLGLCRVYVVCKM